MSSYKDTADGVIETTTQNGDHRWYCRGQLHRRDGPAVVCANGTKQWYIQGVFQREEAASVPAKPVAVRIPEAHPAPGKSLITALPKLYIDLVPSSAWYANLRAVLKPADWDVLRKKTYRDANWKCEVCGGVGPAHPVECHERWHFDEKTGVQSLIDLVALCPACHSATHFGLAQIRGIDGEARAQLKAVNGWSNAQLDEHIERAFEDFERRSAREWTLDASKLFGTTALSAASMAKLTATA